MYLLSDLASPKATYPVASECLSGKIIDDCLYLGGRNLSVYKVNDSLTDPLTLVTVIITKRGINAILSVRNYLLLG